MVQSESVAGVGKCDAGAAPCCPERKKNPEVQVRQEGRAESDEEGARVGVSFFSHTLTNAYEGAVTQQWDDQGCHLDASRVGRTRGE